MKTFFIKDINTLIKGSKVKLFCWIKSVRNHGSILFYDVVDSTGECQVTINKKNFSNKEFMIFSKIHEETAIFIEGKLKEKEIIAMKIEIISDNKKSFSPKLRSKFNIFDSNYADHIQKNKDFYLRNPKIVSALRFKSKYVFELHRYFQQRGYTLIEAPILTERLLYEDKTAFRLEIGKYPVWLSQCCTFQLEPSINAFEKVYNITPSFRAEHSKSERHLSEYTHLKVELAWVNLNDLISISEDLVYHIAKTMSVKGKTEIRELDAEIKIEKLKPPYKRITYNEAVNLLNKNGFNFEWGKSLNSSEEAFLTKYFGDAPLWVQYIPKNVEGFPFKTYPKDKRLTIVSDLIAPNGFGEIAGVAEKITDKEELIRRMKEKGKGTSKQIERYKSYIELRDSGMPFHGGIGLGVDRFARFLMGLPHVRDTLPYPRVDGKRWNP